MDPRPAVRSVRQVVPTPVTSSAQVLAALLGALLLALGLGSPAAAHDTLIGSDPPDGAVLDAAPGSLVLTFSSAQLDLGAAVAVTGADGSAWADGAPVVDGSTVTQALVPQMPSGTYVAEWRSVSGDGHPISGSLSFTLTVPDPATTPEPPADAEAAAEPTGESEAMQEAEVTGTPPSTAQAPADDDPAGQDAQESTGVLSSPWMAAVLALAVVAALVATIVLRRRAADGAQGHDHQHPHDPQDPQDQADQHG